MNGFYKDSYKRVWGNKSINGEVVITTANNVLSVESADGIYEITLAPGTYRTEYTTNKSELIAEIQNKITISSFPIEVFLGGNHQDQKFNVVVLRLNNDKDIEDITGSFFEEYFK